MNLNPIRYLENTITPFDRLFDAGFKDKKKPKVGWCGVFPPYQNGGAAVSYYICRELLRRDDIEVGLIPINNKIEKKLFKGAVFCKIDDPELDVVIFCCLGHEFNKYACRTKAKKIAWQTIHCDPVKSEVEQFNDIDEADRILVMTQWAQQQYKKLCNDKNYNDKKCAYVPFGVDTEYFKPIEKNKEMFQVTFVSRAHYKKGVMPFLDAIHFVAEKVQGCTFHLHSTIDKFSPYFDEIQERVLEMKKIYPNNFFHTMSWIPYTKMKEVYESSSVLVFPSNNEGFGIPLIEAMSSSVPCIVSDVPPLNELVTPSIGFCVKQKKTERYHNIAFPDPKDIAEKIIFLKRNEALYMAMQEKCRAHVKNEYDLKHCVDLLVREIKGVMEN